MIKLNDILQLCCAEFDVTIEDAISKSRKEDFVYVRISFIKISKDIYGYSFEKMSKIINRTKSDVNYLYNKGGNNKYFLTIFNRIKNKIKQINNE